MAKKAKKASTKKTASKKTRAKPAARGGVSQHARDIVIPPGFRPTSNSYAQTWNPNAENHPQELTGIWGQERAVQIKRGRGTQDQRVCTLTTDDGVPWTVWASATLVPLFDEASEGDRVYIRFDGLGVAKRGQHPPKLFTTAIAE